MLAFGLGGTEMIIIVVIILIFVGFRKLPEIGKNVGTALREFQTEANAGLPDEEELADGEEEEGDENDGSGPTKKKAAKPATSIEAEIVGRVIQEVPIIKRVAKIKSKLGK